MAPGNSTTKSAAEVDDDVVTFPESLLLLVFLEGSWQCDGIPQLLVHLQVSAQCTHRPAKSQDQRS